LPLLLPTLGLNLLMDRALSRVSGVGLKVSTMADGKLSIPPHNDAEECLHCAIVDMVEERIAAGGADAANLASLIAESLVDVILRVPEEEQAKLMAHTLAAFGDLFLQKSGTEGIGSGSTH
jgi:hypothetical protein